MKVTLVRDSPGSEKKAAAVRANGALSRGPITPEGRARSSQNAYRHGLYSTTVVLATEDPEAFRALFWDYCDYYQPVGRAEHDLIYQLAACVWRMGRAYIMETQVMDKAADSIPGPRSAAERLTDGYFNVSDSPGAKNLDRFQARLDRTQSRLIHDFLLLLRRRELKPPAAAVNPDPVSEPESPATPDPGPPSQNLRNEPITGCVSNPSTPPESAPSLPERERTHPNAGTCPTSAPLPGDAADPDTASLTRRFEH